MTDTILIVDDSSFIVDGLVSILKKKFNPLAVYGGQQCLDILKKERPAIIILDIMMEPMDGWETLARIKENPATRHIPVLMFSAKKISAAEAEEHRISIDDFVSKPVTPKKLLEAIEKVLDRQKANRECIASWQSAGIGQERIDEYTALVTSQEVDVSLLQNMKVQLSLLRDDDVKIRTDLETVITAIEERIAQERFLEAKLSGEIHESVSRDSEMQVRPVPVPAMHEGKEESMESREEPGAIAPPGPIGSPGIAGAGSSPSAANGPVPEAGVTETVPVPDVHATESRLPGAGASPYITGPASPGIERAEEKSPREEVKIPVTAPPPAYTPIPVLVPPVLPIPKVTPRIPLFTPEVSGHPPVLTPRIDVKIPSPVKVPPVVEQRLAETPVPRPARTIDNKPAVPGTPVSRPVGSGTDTSSRMSSSSRGSTAVPATARDRVPDKKEPSHKGGFLSGIISAILGLFKRPGK